MIHLWAPQLISVRLSFYYSNSLDEESCNTELLNAINYCSELRFLALNAPRKIHVPFFDFEDDTIPGELSCSESLDLLIN